MGHACQASPHGMNQLQPDFSLCSLTLCWNHFRIKNLIVFAYTIKDNILICFLPKFCSCLHLYYLTTHILWYQFSYYRTDPSSPLLCLALHQKCLSGIGHEKICALWMQAKPYLKLSAWSAHVDKPQPAIYALARALDCCRVPQTAL